MLCRAGPLVISITGAIVLHVLAFFVFPVFRVFGRHSRQLDASVCLGRREDRVLISELCRVVLQCRHLHDASRGGVQRFTGRSELLDGRNNARNQAPPLSTKMKGGMFVRRGEKRLVGEFSPPKRQRASCSDAWLYFPELHPHSTHSLCNFITLISHDTTAPGQLNRSTSTRGKITVQSAPSRESVCRVLLCV